MQDLSSLNFDLDFKTIAGLTIATLAVVEGIKQSIRGTRIDKLPVFVWVLGVSAILSWIAVWAGFMTENIKTIFAQVLIQALLASGSWTWITGRTMTTFQGEPPVQSKNTTQLLLIGLLFFALTTVGCAVSPREKAFNTGVKALWTDIKKDWVPRVESAEDLSEQGKLLRIGPKDSLASEMDALIAEHTKAIDQNAP